MGHHQLSCPVCEKSDAVRCKDDPRFYVEGKLTAICFHGHGNGRPVTFDPETGQALKHVKLEPFEALYKVLEQGGARNLGQAFLADYCGIYRVTVDALKQVEVPFPSIADVREAEAENCVITAAPLFDGPSMVGLELRKVEATTGKTGKWYKLLGRQGVYVARPTLQPKVVVSFEGVWDGVMASWDAFNHDAANDYAFTSIKAGTPAAQVIRTHEAHYPGVPVLVITDQDGAGKGARARLRKAGTLAILPGVGLAKDYRAAAPAVRWEALLEGIERALDHGPGPTQETGIALIARRALEGAIRGKQEGLRDLEAWRFGQRCAGICKAPAGGKRFFSIRASIHGRTPVAEGLYEFSDILQHRAFRDLHADLPSLASVVEGGATENPMSPEWKPPIFLPDGRHWTELPPQERKLFACAHGWEPWTGKDVGPYDLDDLRESLGQVVGAYAYTISPNVPSSDVGMRVFIFALATALCALRAEELWLQEIPTGFLPWLWAYGQPATGKGTVAKIIAAMVSGQTRTFGSQRFGGERENSWLTESILHMPVVFKDELDQYLDRTALEDLKTFISGEALQKRKAYGTDMTLPPRPVVFATNEIKINTDDVATKERIILLQLDKNTRCTDKERNNAFETFRAWFQEEGCQALHRVAIHVYKRFRTMPFQKSRFTRSAMFDTAFNLVCSILGRNPDAMMDPSQSSKEAAILHGAPWYRAMADYIQHDLVPGVNSQSVKAVDIWGLNPSNESDMKKLRRYLGAITEALRDLDGGLQFGEVFVKPTPFHAPAPQRSFVFYRNAEVDIG